VAGTEGLLVRCRGTLCSLDVPLVREVVRPLPMAELPHMPPCVLGAVSHRGEAFPVVDLGLLLGLGSCEVLATTRLVVVQLPLGRLGILVERVEGVGEPADARVVDLVAALEASLALQSAAGKPSQGS
jgi:chemotaxis signal transduction protein